MKRYFSIALSVLLTFAFLYCSKTKEINPESFLSMQNEIISSDQTDASKENIVKKYGFSVAAYDEYNKKVETDPALKAKIGELVLKQNQKK